MSRFVIRTSSAKMPSSCRGRYRHIAVMEMQEDAPDPAQISLRAKGCIRIVRQWNNQHVGQPGGRSEYYRAMAEAEALVNQLNVKEEV